MDTRSPLNRASYRWIAICLLAAIGVYGWYVVNQFAQLNALNQRELANAGVELRRALELAVNTVDNFTPQPTDQMALCNFDEDQPYLSLDTPCWPSPGALDGVTLSTEPSLAIDAKPRRGASTAERTRFAFLADTLLHELAFPDSFELVFVVNGKGRVLHQDAPRYRQWRRLLTWGEQSFRDAGADAQAGLQVQSLASALGNDDGAAWTMLSATSTRTTMQLGGVWHQVYLQPLVLGNGAATLVIGGAVPTAVVIRDALAVDSSFMAILVFIVLVSVLGLPFVKLSALDRHERFRLRDVTLLYLSTGALLALFTFAILGLDGYRRWNDVATTGLEELARTLAHQFTTELQSIRTELATYDTRIAAGPPRDCKAWPVRTSWYDTPAELPLPMRDVFIEQVAWIRPGGEQLWKATTDKVGGKVDVGHRVYFQAVRDGHLYRVPDDPAPFFVGPDRSITDGKFYTFVSMPSAIRTGFCTDAPTESGYVAVATARLLSVRRPALPAGYGFALVNREGRVLYHSDPRLTLRENVFEELGDGERVRAMVYSGRVESLATRYRERPHQLVLQPIALERALDRSPAGLYLIAFRDTSIERAVVARVFVIGLVGPILLPIAFIGGTM